MDCIIREMQKNEFYMLRDFLYEASFVPVGVERPPNSILN